MTGRTNHRTVTQGMAVTTPTFPADPTGLPEAVRSALLELTGGDDLQIGAVAKGLGHTTEGLL